MKKQKGRQIEKWNWQAHEAKFGAQTDISSEYDILSHYGSDSNEEENDRSAIMTSASQGRKKSKGVTFRKRGHAYVTTEDVIYN